MIIFLMFCSISQKNSTGDSALDQSVYELKRQLLKSYHIKERKTIAISAFARNDLLRTNSKYASVIPKLGIVYANTLQNEMFQPDKYDLIERQRIDSILRELTYEQIGLGGDGANNIKLSGADLVLLGNLQLREETIRVDARIVDLSNGKILSVGTSILPISNFIEDLYNEIPLEKK